MFSILTHLRGWRGLAVAMAAGALASAMAGASEAHGVAAFRTPQNAAFCGLSEGEGDPRLICWTPNDGFTISAGPRAGRPTYSYDGANRGYVEPSARLLGFGRSWRVWVYRCSSASSGLTCRNGRGAGFWLGRFHGYRIIAARKTATRQARRPLAIITANLDSDPRKERLLKIRAGVRFPGGTVPGHRWVVEDIVNGKRVRRSLGPASERSKRPRLGDRNANGVRDILLETANGNSLFDGRIFEWDSRRLRQLWRLDLRSLEAVTAPGEIVAGYVPPISFSDLDADGVREVQVNGYLAACRACVGREVPLVWAWSSASMRWVLEP